MEWRHATERFYRWSYSGGLEMHHVSVKETDLALCLPPGVWSRDLERQVMERIRRLRRELEDYLEACPEFGTTHAPFEPPWPAPDLALRMAEACRRAGVGPMAAVAGAFASEVGRFLEGFTPEVLVENGGDLWMTGTTARIVGLFAGDSPFSGRLGLRIPAAMLPLGVCTSSGTVGPSFSYGRADAATILAPDALLADAVATATANRVQTAADLQGAVEFAVATDGVVGALAIQGSTLAVQGAVELVRL